MTNDLAEQMIAILRAHEMELRDSGTRHLSLFGSVSRGEADSDSDVDLAAKLEPDSRIGHFALAALAAVGRVGWSIGYTHRLGVAQRS